jgi:hypothetical protein
MSEILKDMEEFMSSRDHVLIPDLLDALEEKGYEIEGDQEITFTSDPNVIVWGGVTEEVAVGFIQGLSEEKFHLVPELIDRYMEKGIWIDLPEAVKFPKKGYTTPHWAVTCLRPGKYESPTPEKESESA